MKAQGDAGAIYDEDTSAEDAGGAKTDSF